MRSGGFMRMDKLTSKLQQALADAQSLAVGRDHNYLEPVHLITALLDQRGGSLRPLLTQTGFDVPALRAGLEKQLEALPRVGKNDGQVNVSPQLSRLLNLADSIAQKSGDQYLSSETILLAAMQDSGELGKLLNSFGVSKAALENAVKNLRGGTPVDSPEAEESRQALQRFTVDVTEKAALGKLDPVIGRDDEIRRTIQVLQRRTKNNPVLIGEPGVGKIAAVPGLATRCAYGLASDRLKGKDVASLHKGAQIAGAGFRDDFGRRLWSVFSQAKRLPVPGM